MDGMKTGGLQDHRIVFYGLRHCIETHISKKWTMDDVHKAKFFFSTHNAFQTNYVFPEELFVSFIRDYDGYFPVKIQALPEGSVIYPRTPVFIMSAEEQYAPLCTYLETLLTMVWYPSCVATISRYVRDIIDTGFKKTANEEMNHLADSRLHDFGMRSCTSLDQSIIGGCAHLLSFNGSDNMAAAYHVQVHLNNGIPIATSVPSTEHSVMTSFENETDAIDHQIHHFAHGVFSIVMDSYDYANALDNILPQCAAKVLEKGGMFVIRPDSGNPVEQVMLGLQAAEKCFPVVINSKGYKVIQGCAVLQGDGIDYEQIRTIQNTVMGEGFSTECVLYGMGSALLQKVNRDTMSFATKLCYLEDINGVGRDIMKTPKNASSKFSLPGELFVGRSQSKNTIMVYTKDEPRSPDIVHAMRTVWNYGPVEDAFEPFQRVKARLAHQWKHVPPRGDAISPALRAKIAKFLISRSNS